MRLIGLVWFVLASLIFGVLVILKPPRPDLANVVAAVLILGGPGLLLVKLAGDLREHGRGSLVALLLLPLSFVLFAGYGCFVLLRTFGPPP